MIKKTINIIAIILNVGIVAFICGLIINEDLEMDNVNTWFFIIITMATPVMNLIALSGKLKIMPILSLVVNTLVLLLATLVIFLVVIWPMGSKPHGLELIYILSLYSALLFSEVALILRKIGPR